MRTPLPAAPVLALAMTLGWCLPAPAGEPRPAAESGSQEWPMIAGDAGHTGRSADERVKPPFRLRWAVQTDYVQKMGISVAAGKVFTAGMAGDPGLCLDAETGDVLWEHSCNGTPACDGRRVYCWSSKNYGLKALDPATGKVLWQKPGGCPINRGTVSSPVFQDGVVYHARKDAGGIYVEALKAENGDPAWSARVAPAPPGAAREGIGDVFGVGWISSLSADGERVYASTLDPKAVFALDRKSGKEVWRQEGICAAVAVGTDGAHAWAAADRYGVWQLDAKTGEKQWHWGGSKEWFYNFFDTAGYPPCPAFDLVLANCYGNFTALAAKSGEKLWECGREKRLLNKGCSMPTAAGGYVYSPALYGADYSIYAIDPRTRQPVWGYRTGDRFCSRAAIAYGRIYAPCHDGRIYCLEPVGPDYQPPEPQAAPAAPAAPPKPLAERPAGKPGSPESGDKPKGGADWPMYGGCPARCGLELAIGLPIKEAWKFQTGGRVRSSPVIAGGLAYAGSDSGKLFALDLRTGQERWSVDFGCRIRSAPAVADGIAVCGGEDGLVRAFEAAIGKPRWQFKTGGAVRASPAIAGERVVFAGLDRSCYCLRLSDGAELWRRRIGQYRDQFKAGREFWLHRTGSEVHTPPAVALGTVYLGAWEDHEVIALDLGTGEPRAGFTPYRAGRPEGVAVYRGVLAACHSHGGTSLIDPATGQGLAELVESSPYVRGAPAFSGRWIFDYCSYKGVPLSDLSPAARPRQIEPRPARSEAFKADQLIPDVPLIAGDLMIAATSTGRLEVRRLKDGSAAELVWEWKSPGGARIATAPAAAGGFIVLGSDDGHVYGFSYASGAGK